MPTWNFITNYGTVLSLITRNPSMTAREVAFRLGITERSVHRIIVDLELEGYIHKVREGRHNRYEVNPELSLRSPNSRNTPVKELIKILVPGDKMGSVEDNLTAGHA